MWAVTRSSALTAPRSGDLRRSAGSMVWAALSALIRSASSATGGAGSAPGSGLASVSLALS